MLYLQNVLVLPTETEYSLNHFNPDEFAHWKSLKCAFSEIFPSETDKQERSDLVWSCGSTSIGGLIGLISTVFEKIWEHKDRDSFTWSCCFPYSTEW